MAAWKRPAILLVEDDYAAAGIFREALASMGFDPYAVVSTVAAASAAAAKRRPDVVLMNAGLRGEHGGISAARILQTQFDVPLIYFAESPDPDLREEAMGTKPVAYIVKPFALEELREAVELALSKKPTEGPRRTRSGDHPAVRAFREKLDSFDVLQGQIDGLNEAIDSCTSNHPPKSPIPRVDTESSLVKDEDEPNRKGEA